MPQKQNSTNKSRLMKMLSVLLMSTLSLLTCSNTLAAPTLGLPYTAQESTEPSLIPVDQEKLNQFVEFAEACQKFSLACKERVGLLEQYRAEADKVIETQTQQITDLKSDLDFQKTKSNYLIPGATLLLGFLIGFIVVK